MPVRLFSSGGELLHEGFMVEGRMTSEVKSPKSASDPRWRGVITLVDPVSDKENNNGLIVKQGDLREVSPLLIGRLHEGRLSGPVRTFGQMAMDPHSECLSREERERESG